MVLRGAARARLISAGDPAGGCTARSCDARGVWSSLPGAPSSAAHSWTKGSSSISVSLSTSCSAASRGGSRGASHLASAANARAHTSRTHTTLDVTFSHACSLRVRAHAYHNAGPELGHARSRCRTGAAAARSPGPPSARLLHRPPLAGPGPWWVPRLLCVSLQDL